MNLQIKTLKDNSVHDSYKKEIKFLAINLIEDLKNLYSENYKPLLTEIEKRGGKKLPMFLDWKN